MAGPSLFNGKPAHIDVHHHFYPPEFRQAVNEFSGSAMPIVERWTPEASLEEMDKGGVSTAILSLWSIPGVWMGARPEGMRRWARLVNEYAAQMRHDHPGRFGLFAALPLPDVEGSLAEIEHAFDVLGADGVGLMTNFGDTWPGDPKYRPVFEELNRHSGGTVPVIAGRTGVLSHFSPRMKEVAPHGVDHELQRLHYETANGYHAPNMAALMAYVPVSQIMFGTDYPYVSVEANVDGIAKIVSGADLDAIRSGNALRMFPQHAVGA